MFEHSVKVPRHYKIAANIFKKVSTEGGSVKTLLYDDKLRHFRTNVLYALITETIKHASDIDKIFENSKILENEDRLDPWLAKILTAELLFGKKALPGKSKPEQTVLSYKDQFEKFISDHQDDLKTEVTRRPRYVRINTNLLTTSDAIRAFQDEGYRFIRCTSGSYADYLEQIQKLTEEDFTQDYHVKTMFVFSSGTKLHEHELYLENKIILQDKATAMAVHLLAPPPGSTVLDMCAAPGMKTTQVAAYIRNTGKVYAVERNEKRYQTLCDFVKKTASDCVETIHKDALEIKRGDMDDVDYILLDPSCSGSGMEFCVHSYIESSRLAKLTSLQEKFLKHAMNAFPKAKRIVYSTCSLFPEENERVITNVVKTSRAKWRVQDVKELLKGQWNNFGSGMYGSIGTRCMYARPDSDLAIGFFLAVLDRDQKDLEKANNQKLVKDNKRNQTQDERGDGEDAIVEDATTNPEKQAESKPKKKKKKHYHYDVSDNIEDGNGPEDKEHSIAHETSITDRNEELAACKSKKKKKKDIDVDNNTADSNSVDLDAPNIADATSIPDGNEEQAARNSKKKKKKDVDDNTADSNSVDLDAPNIADATSIPDGNEEHAARKSKKKKKKYIDVNDNTADGDSVELDAPKKVKNKRKNDVVNDVIKNLNDLVMEETVVKKKKKKDKCREVELNEINAEDTVTNNVIISEEVSKKKKKRKNEVFNEVQAVDVGLQSEP